MKECPGQEVLKKNIHVDTHIYLYVLRDENEQPGFYDQRQARQVQRERDRKTNGKRKMNKRKRETVKRERESKEEDEKQYKVKTESETAYQTMLNT